jgi:hypothetical protein
VDRVSDSAEGDRLEEALADLLYDYAEGGAPVGDASPEPRLAQLDAGALEEARQEVQRMVRHRVYRGSGGLIEWYPTAIADWRAKEPADGDLTLLIARFCGSRACRGWRETPASPLGISLEEAFYRFFVEAGIGDPNALEVEMLGAVIRTLAISPRARFKWPAAVIAAPGGCFAITRSGVLHAAMGTKYLTGPITPLVSAVLLGEPEPRIVARFDVAVHDLVGLTESLRRMGLRA